MNTAKTLSPDFIKFNVKITSGPHTGDTFLITKESFSIGRGAENDIILINDPKLSRSHIKASLKDSVLIIENLSTRNPILFNDKIENLITVKPHDKIKIGDTEIELIWDQSTIEKTKMAEGPTQLTLSSQTEMITQNIITNPESPNIKGAGAVIVKPVSPGSELTYIKKNHLQVNENHQQPALRQATFASKPIKSTSEKKSSGLTKNSNFQNTSKNFKNDDFLKTYRIPVIFVSLFIAIIIVLSLGGEKKIKKPSLLKDTNQLSAELNKSNQVIENYMKEKKLQDDGRMDRIYESAQSYYVKGFRDYRQGQYSRALISFQAALSFDPNHVLAKKYLLQSIKKHSEQVQFNLDQAKRYRDKSNYRLCSSAAKQVIIMALRKDQSDPYYKEGKNLFDECDILSKGRF